MKLKNENIEISELGEESKFISGNKYWFIEWAKVFGQLFKKGDKVRWYSEDDNKNYSGKIEWLIVTDDGSVEVSIDNPKLGRLDVENLEKIK